MNGTSGRTAIEDYLKLAEKGPRSSISLRVEDEVLDYFRRQGPGYQRRMHAVLKAFVLAQKSLEHPAD